MDNTYVYVLIGYHGKRKKLRIDGFHGDYLTVSFPEGLDTAVGSVDTVTAIRGSLYEVPSPCTDILSSWAEHLPPMLAEPSALKVVATLWLCFLPEFPSVASAHNTCHQNKQKPLCGRIIQISTGVEQIAYQPLHLDSSLANLTPSPRLLEALEHFFNSRHSILL